MDLCVTLPRSDAYSRVLTAALGQDAFGNQEVLLLPNVDAVVLHVPSQAPSLERRAQLPDPRLFHRPLGLESAEQDQGLSAFDGRRGPYVL